MLRLLRTGNAAYKKFGTSVFSINMRAAVVLTAVALGLGSLGNAKSIGDYKLERQQRAAAYAEAVASTNEDNSDFHFQNANSSSEFTDHEYHSFLPD